MSIAEVADEFAVSQRQLQRLYHTQVGMIPKQYAQLQRVENARIALKANNSSNTDPALELGYFDQAHFIREFNSVVGMTPYKYIRRNP